MIPQTFCYFSNKTEIHQAYADGLSATVIKSDIFNCIIDDSCYFRNDIKKSNIIANCIYMFLLKKPYFKTSNYWFFYYEEAIRDDTDRNVNVYTLFLKYPTTILGKTDLALRLIGQQLEISSNILTNTFIENHYRVFLPEDRLSNYSTMLDFLCQRGLVHNYKLTIEGWNRIDELNRKDNLSNQIFIASQFDGFDEVINCVKKSAIECGYSPIYMKDYQTNDYIMPEIFSLIDNSRAVIGEISSSNNGVYFEIGYARGKEKDIILICKAERDENGKFISKSHFDVAQVSIIYYENNDDLMKKLMFRIQNTIKKN